MEVALLKVDLTETFDAIKSGIANADKRVLSILGFAVGSYVAYEALECISMAGKTENKFLRKIHEFVREYYNCGYLIKRRHFYSDPRAYVVNYGSYGVLPKPVFQYKIKLEEEMERCPDEWFFLKLRNKWYESCKQVADAVGANPQNMAFVHNVTEAINCVVRSVGLTPKDAVLITNHTYGAVKNIVDYYTSKAGAKMVTMEIPFPIQSEQEICDLYNKVLSDNPGIKFAIIDHITSASALLMPVEDLVKICKKHDVLTLIDGAHAPGQLPLEIMKIGADFYGGNLHKWYFAPRGCAFVWARQELLANLDPSLVSHNYNKGFQDRFYKQGTDDNTNYMAGAYAVTEYYPSIGGMEHIYKTNIPMRQWASKLFRDTWKTESPNIPSTMQPPYLEIVEMPESIIQYYGATPQGAEECKLDLMRQYNVYMMVSAVNGTLWCRVSCQICSTKKEYFVAALAVKKLAQSIRNKIQ